jgi:hypothetical protein
MRDQYIFDIPVYRLTSDEFDAEIELHLARRIKWLRSFDPQQRPLSPAKKDQQRDEIIVDSGGPWQFNQVIGWLRLFAEGQTIGCHLWWLKAKRIIDECDRSVCIFQHSVIFSAHGSPKKPLVKYSPFFSSAYP